MSHQSGVYEIVNTVNGKRYIGSANNFELRWRMHRSQLQRKVHHAIALQRAWNKYGASSFIFWPLLICAPQKGPLIMYEQLCIDGLHPAYNSALVAGSPQGVTRSPETRAKISAAKKGKKHPPEFGAAISARTRGVRRTPTQRAAMSARMQGTTVPPEVRAKISLALQGNTCAVGSKSRLGQKHTPETIEKMRAARKAWHIRHKETRS